MANSEQIKEEAKRRVAQMSEQEKIDIWGFSDEENELLTYAEKVGSKNLNPEQYSKFRQLVAKHGFRMIPNGIKGGGIEHVLEEEFNISKDDLRKGGIKNPFKAAILRDIIIAIIINAISAGLALGGLSPIAIGLESTLTFLGADFVGQVSRYVRFKRAQKQYQSGEMDEEELRTEIMKELFEQRGQRWSR